MKQIFNSKIVRLVALLIVNFNCVTVLFLKDLGNMKCVYQIKGF